MLDAARPHLLRIVGPGSFGLIVPGARLNASLAHGPAAPGRLALLAQSGAVAAAMVDWAAERGIGFSRVVSLGAMADADAGDFLDLLAMDGATRAILAAPRDHPGPAQVPLRRPRRRPPQAGDRAQGRAHAAGRRGRAHPHRRALGRRRGGRRGAAPRRHPPGARARRDVRRRRDRRALQAARPRAPRDRDQRRRPRRARRRPARRDRRRRSPRWRPTPSRRCRRAARRRTRSTCAPTPPAERYGAALDALAADRGVDALLVLHAPSVLGDPLAVAHAVAGAGRAAA